MLVLGGTRASGASPLASARGLGSSGPDSARSAQESAVQVRILTPALTTFIRVMCLAAGLLLISMWACAGHRGLCSCVCTWLSAHVLNRVMWKPGLGTWCTMNTRMEHPCKERVPMECLYLLFRAAYHNHVAVWSSNPHHHTHPMHPEKHIALARLSKEHAFRYPPKHMCTHTHTRTSLTGERVAASSG